MTPGTSRNFKQLRFGYQRYSVEVYKAYQGDKIKRTQQISSTFYTFCNSIALSDCRLSSFFFRYTRHNNCVPRVPLQISLGGKQITSVEFDMYEVLGMSLIKLGKHSSASNAIVKTSSRVARSVGYDRDRYSFVDRLEFDLFVK